MRYWGLIALVVLAACGGGAPGAERFAVVQFPLDGGVTDAAEMAVRGTTPGAVAVRVNGVAATSRDGFLTWRAVVALARGSNRLQVEAEEADGSVHATSVTVRREEILTGAADVALDAANGRLLVVQSLTEATKALTGIDLVTGEGSIVSGEFVGAGPFLEAPERVAVDVAGNRALVFDGDLRALVSIDLANGDRTIVSDDAVGDGADFTWVSDLGIDASRNRALAIDGSRLITIDLASGDRAHFTDDFDNLRQIAMDPARDRVIALDDDLIVAANLANSALTLLSGNSTGSGPALDSAQGIAFDAARNVVLVASYRDELIEVDLATGDRTILSDAGTGSGVAFSGPYGLVVDAARGRALVNDRNDGRDAIVAVSLTSGNRSVLFESARGTGPFFDDPREVVLDLARNRALVADPGSDADHILAVDLRTGNRTTLAEYPIGNPEGLVVEAGRNRILITDTQGVIYAMDPDSGARSVLSDAATGSGPELEVPEDLVLDVANDRALVVDRAMGALLAIDLATGNRTIVSDNSKGSGTTLESPTDVELDAANGRAIVIDGDLGAVLAIDLQTGDRTILSGDGVGSGPEIRANEGFCLDLARNRALLTERGALVAVDLTSGDRTIVSGPETGTGPRLDNTLEDVVLLPGDVALIISDANSNFLFAVDLETGDRLVFSK